MITALMPKFPSQTPDMNEEQKQSVIKTAIDNNRPLIEVISSTDNDEVEMEEQKESIPVSIHDMDVKLIKSINYGFNNLYQDVFSHRKEELIEFAEIDPEQIWNEDRHQKMIESEKEKFDDERYVADTFSEAKHEIQQMIDQQHPFEAYLALNEMDDVTKRLEYLNLNSEDQVLIAEEITECLKLRNREYIIDKTSPNLPIQ